MKQLLRPENDDDITDVNLLPGNAEDISNIVDDIDAQLSSITSELGADKLDVKFTVKVYRVVENKAELAWLFDCTPAELPILQKLRDEYDGGRFECRVYKNNRIYKRVKVVVETPKKLAVTQPAKNEMSEMLKEMGRQQQDNFNMLKDTVMQMVGKPSTPQPSQMEMMTGMMALMASMKNFVSPPVQPSVSPDKMIEVLIKGMELGRDSGGGSETGLMDIAKELIKSPLLGQLAQAATTMPQLPRQQAQMQIPVQAKPAQPQMTTQPQPATQPKGTVMQTQVLKHYLDMLVKKAEKDSDPILYAEFILDNVPQSMVEENIMRDDLIEYASTIDPRVKDHQEWFIELRDHIITVLTSPDEEEETDSTDLTSPATGDNATGSPDNSTDDPKRASGDTPDA